MRRVIAVKDGWAQTAPTTLFGPEFPQVYTRSIVNRVLAEWKGKEDRVPTPPPPPAVVGTARLRPWSVARQPSRRQPSGERWRCCS